MVLQLAALLLALAGLAAGSHGAQSPAQVGELSRVCPNSTGSRSPASLQTLRGHLDAIRELESGQQLIQQQLVQRQLAEQKLQALREQLTNRTQQYIAEAEAALQRASRKICPCDWELSGSSCYLVTRQQVNWLQAHRLCSSLHGAARLASVHPASRAHIHVLCQIDLE